MYSESGSHNFSLIYGEKMQKKTEKEPRIIVGVIILMFSNIIVKVIGVLFKIPLHNLLSDIGMSYFNTAYSIFTTLYLISTAGLPSAISIMVSKARAEGKNREVKRIFYTSLALFFVVGIIGTSIMLFGAGGLADIMGTPDAASAIMAISPTLFLICISSSVRGYFQGHQNMLPTAISEVIESLGKFAIGVLFGSMAVKNGKSLEICAAYAILGVAVGEAAGMLFLLCAKFLHKKDANPDFPESSREVSSPAKILKNLLIISIPIMLSAVALNLTSTVDMFTIVNVLSRRIPKEAAEEAYGNYTTLAVTLFHLPSALIQPISTSLTPAIAAARAANNEKKTAGTLGTSLKMTVMLSIPCAVGLAILSKPILGLLFSNADSVEKAAPLLTIIAPAVFFSAILTVTSAALQACGFQRKPIISMTCGIAVKATVSTLLMSSEKIGILGAPIGTLAGYFVMATLNFIFVLKYVGVKINILKLGAKPLLASALSSCVTVGVYRLIANANRPNVATVVSVISTAIVYFILLFVLKEFTKNDIMILPKGEKIYSLLCKAKLMKKEDEQIQ